MRRRAYGSGPSMTFTTLTFLLFLALFFPLYWALRNRTAQNLLIVAGSYFFYGWWDWRFCGLMLVSSLLDYFAGLALNHPTAPRQRRAILFTAMAGNISLLGFFKYFNFFAESLQAAAAGLGWKLDLPVLHVVLPVGISFYTFQTMSYTIDVYRGKLRATGRIVEYLAYVSFFPQLVAGPIERATHLLPQFFQARVFRYDLAVDGCRQMLWGFFKKLVIADNLAPLVEMAFSDPAGHRGIELAAGTVCFALQIYCDFSAYSDIACGVARLLGFDLMRNFACPYFSQSMAEFWRRWHISLTTWFKDYVYIPLGGGRGGRWRHARNVLLTFLLSGLWHGASWNFVLWGLLNGLLVLPQTFSSTHRGGRVDESPGGAGWLPKPAVVLRMLLTFALVCVGWVFFRAATLADAGLILRKVLLDHDGLVDVYHATAFVRQGPLAGQSYGLVAVLLLVEWLGRSHAHALAGLARWPWPLRWLAYLALTSAILWWGNSSSSPFIYFQF